MFDQFRNYIGYGKLLCYKDRDQGDTAQLEGIYFSLNKMMGITTDIITKKPLQDRYNAVIKELEVEPGVYRRCSNVDHWGSKPDNLSRDNRSQLEIGMAIMEDRKRLKEAALYILKRGGFHQNVRHGTDDPENKWKVPDFITPSELAVYIRGLKIPFMKPILYILDSFLLLDLKFRVGDRTYDNMLANQMLFHATYNPTLISKYALKKYKDTDFREKIDFYYTEDDGRNGLLPMAKLYRAAYEKLS